MMKNITLFLYLNNNYNNQVENFQDNIFYRSLIQLYQQVRSFMDTI